MRLSDILAIGIWAFLFYLAIIRLVILRCPWSLIRSRLGTAMPALVALFAFSAFSGFVMSGSVGLVGNSIAGLLWGAWFFLMWVPQRPRQS